MRTLPYAQGTPEWLQARVGRVTASKINAVMANGRDGKPSATRAAYMGELIAQRLTGQYEENGYTNADMQRGTELEPFARAAYEVQTGVMVDEVGLVLHPENDWFGASPDGVVGSDGLLEIKCPKTHIHIAYMLAGKPPAEYVPQMAWQAACCDRKWVDFVSYDPKMPDRLQLFIVRYTPEPDYIAAMEKAARQFLVELEDKLSALNQIAER